MFPFCKKTTTKDPYVQETTAVFRVFRDYRIEVTFGPRALVQLMLFYRPDLDEERPIFCWHRGISILPHSPAAWFKNAAEDFWRARGWWGRSTTGYDRCNTHFGVGRWFRLHRETPGNHMHWLGSDEDWVKLVRSRKSTG